MRLSERAIFRKRAGLTQHQLAKRTGIFASRISLWENAEVELAPGEVEKIARVLAAELSKLPPVSSETEITGVLTAGVGA